MRVVICDTGPILHLHEARALKLLADVGEVIAPVAVDEELTRRVPNWSRDRPSWVRVQPVSDEQAVQAEQLRAAAGLGLGETEAIALARALRADWLLTDDAGARLVASLLGLEAHGSLGVILWAAAHGHLQREEAFSVLERLAKSSLWISPGVLNDARRALEILFR